VLKAGIVGVVAKTKRAAPFLWFQERRLAEKAGLTPREARTMVEAPKPATVKQLAVLERAESLAAALARDLDRCAALHAVMARELEAAYP
jgi:hypothetical protein